MAAMSPISEGIARRDAAPGQPRERRGIPIAFQVGAGVSILAATALVVGLGPFLRGFAAISPASVLAALLLAVVATSASAWRWRVVADGYGLPLSVRGAFAAYYRSQFLNAVLPAGVVGDVHRAWAHGRDRADLGRAARAVAAERILGQTVQIVLTVAILLTLGLGSALVPLIWCAGAIAAVATVAAALATLVPRARVRLRQECALLRPVLARPSALFAIVLTSVVVVAAHLALFLVASLAVGLPLGSGIAATGLVVLAASAIPLNVGGWGPREAVAGAAFGLAGLGASGGVAVSAAFGVLALIGVSPGLVVLFIARRRRP